MRWIVSRVSQRGVIAAAVIYIIVRFGRRSREHEVPYKRAAIVAAFVFVASSEASYVNGEVLGVTGGKPLG